MNNENMPNIDFSDLKILKKLKSDLFDEEFYALMKSLKYEFQEPVYLLR